MGPHWPTPFPSVDKNLRPKEKCNDQIKITDPITAAQKEIPAYPLGLSPLPCGSPCYPSCPVPSQCPLPGKQVQRFSDTGCTGQHKHWALTWAPPFLYRLYQTGTPPQVCQTQRCVKQKKHTERTKMLTAKLRSLRQTWVRPSLPG